MRGNEQGHLLHPLVTLQGGGPLPARATTPGRLVTFSVYAVPPTGSGTLHWAPSGGAPLVSWDFDVEID